MPGQIQEIITKFRVDDADFVFQVVEDQAVLTQPARGVRVKLTTAEWLAVGDIARRSLGDIPLRQNPREPNAGARWTAEMDAELLNQWNVQRATLTDIAKAMGRSPYGITLRLGRHLGTTTEALYAENTLRHTGV